MKSRDFCYWLQGYFELQNRSSEGEVNALGSSQVRSIQQHLALVFKHEIDPSAGNAEHQAELNAIHAPMHADAEEDTIEAIKKAGAEMVQGVKKPKIGGVGPDGTVYRC